jgi:hypothetical protein
MTSKYGFSDIRDQLIKDVKGAYPTKWQEYQAADVLGEDVFGSPKPHPNAVLSLFSEQNVRFALPFAAYRASIDGFSALMSDEPGTVLPRPILATTACGMHLVGVLMGQATGIIAYEGNLAVCADTACVLSVGLDPIEQRMEALKKLRDAIFLAKRDGGELTLPSLGHLVCLECAKVIQALHVVCGSTCWEQLPRMFSVAQSWDEV